MSIQYLPSNSGAVSLTVGLPANGEILEFRVPPASKFGEPVELAVGVRNIGERSARIWVDVWDTDTGVKLWESDHTMLSAGEFIWFYSGIANAPIMPNRVLSLTCQAHHDVAIIDSMVTEIVPLLAEVATALSTTIDPIMVAPGENYTHSGTLIRVDTGTGIGGQTVILKRSGVEQGSTITDGAGNYSLLIPAPLDVGSYACDSEYLGSIQLGFGRSISNQVSFTSGSGLGISAPWLIVGGAAIVGAIIYYLAKRKKKRR